MRRILSPCRPRARPRPRLTVLHPTPPSGFYTLCERFVDPSFAFAMGWNYVLQWAVVLPLEITVAVTTVNYWNNGLPDAAWITVRPAFPILCRRASRLPR